MDREHFRDRVRALRAQADEVSCLTAIPDRVKPQDLKATEHLLRAAAYDIEQLVKARPTGCICRHIQDDNYDYFDYDAACLHHGQLYRIREGLKADYAKMEKALKNEARLRFATAVLSGTDWLQVHDDTGLGIKRALAIADGVLDHIDREVKAP